MTSPKGRLDTSEQLLSSEAIERALEGRDGEDRARAFREHLDEHPEAEAALEKYRRIAEGRETAPKLPLRRESPERAEPVTVAVEPRPAERRQWPWLLVPLLLILGGAGLFAWLKAPPMVDSSASSSAAQTSPPTETATSASAVTAEAAQTDSAAQTTPPPVHSAAPAKTGHPSPPPTSQTSAKPVPSATARASSGLYFESKP